MKCPQCGTPDDPIIARFGENSDGTTTCLACGLIFRVEEHDVDKMLEAVNNLRSCIVILATGEDITLSYPKNIGDGKFKKDIEKDIWRRVLRLNLSEFVTSFFGDVKVNSIVFDDELEVKHG